MHEWKQACSLAKFELKISIVNILICWIVMTFFSLSFLTSFNSYVEKNFIGFDIFFIIGLSLGPFLFRSKHYQYQKYTNQLYASPTLIMMTQLPIPKEILIKSRLMITFVYILPFMFTIFPITYVFIPGVSELWDISTYFAFFIICLFISLIIGMMLPASDPGDKITSLKSAIYFVVASLSMLIILCFFHLFLNYGIVAWLMHLAQNRALLSIIILIILFFISWKCWTFHMTNKMKRLDYF